MYSPAARPSRQRAAPAKKRRLSAITGISSLCTAASGLPAVSASVRASSSALSSITCAIASSALERSAGVVRDQPSNARRAARTARSTSSALERGARAISSPVAGLSTGSLSPSQAARWPSMKLLRVSTVLACARSGAIVSPRSLCVLPVGPPPLAGARDRQPERLGDSRMVYLASPHIQTRAQRRALFQGVLHAEVGQLDHVGKRCVGERVGR